MRTWRPSPLARAGLAVAVVLVLTATARRSTGDGPGIPAAQARPSIGALLRVTGAPAQVCTAAVIDSVAGDVIVTAAHCLSGSTGALMFAPGYHSGGRTVRHLDGDGNLCDARVEGARRS